MRKIISVETYLRRGPSRHNNGKAKEIVIEKNASFGISIPVEKLETDNERLHYVPNSLVKFHVHFVLRPLSSNSICTC